MLSALDAELTALLEPMAEGGELGGAQLKRFNELIARIGLAQARAARAAAEGNPELMRFEDGQIKSFEKQLEAVDGPRQPELFAA